MKVLMLAPHPFYIERGTPIDVDLMLRALDERGERVDVVTYPQGEDRSYRNVRIFRCRAPRWAQPAGPGFSLRKLVCDAFLFITACRLMRKERYDLVHAGEEAVFIALLFRLLLGVPYVYDLDSSIAQQMVEKMGFLRPLAPLLNTFEAWAIRGAVACAPVCNALADLCRQRGAKRIVTIHDISLQDPSSIRSDGSLRRRLGLQEATLMMYVGNLETYQGIDLLLDSFPLALRQGGDFHLVIAGGSEHHIAKYREKARRLGVAERTHFIGPWPVQQLGELLAEADVLVAPRIKGVNTPMKVFPYLHSGKPVLVTDLPTHSQVLTPEVAMLAPAEPEGFAQAMVRLARDQALRTALGAAGQAFVEREHTYPAHRRRVNELYDPLRKTSAASAAVNMAPEAPEPR